MVFNVQLGRKYLHSYYTWLRYLGKSYNSLLIYLVTIPREALQFVAYIPGYDTQGSLTIRCLYTWLQYLGKPYNSLLIYLVTITREALQFFAYIPGYDT